MGNVKHCYFAEFFTSWLYIYILHQHLLFNELILTKVMVFKACLKMCLSTTRGFCGVSFTEDNNALIKNNTQTDALFLGHFFSSFSTGCKHKKY